MSIRQRIIWGIFRWAQSLLDPPPPGSVKYQIVGKYDHVPTAELQTACGLLDDYQEIELSTVTHNIGQDDQYTCVLLVGKKAQAMAGESSSISSKSSV